MNDEPVGKSWIAGIEGDTPPRHLIHGHLLQENADRLREMTTGGVSEVQVICATDHECPACAALDGKIFPVDDAPVLPPEKCSCIPHCTCILTGIVSR